MSYWVDKGLDGTWLIFSGEHEADSGTVATVYGSREEAETMAAAFKYQAALEGLLTYARASASSFERQRVIKRLVEALKP